MYNLYMYILATYVAGIHGGVTSQAEDAEHSRAPGLTSGFLG